MLRLLVPVLLVLGLSCGAPPGPQPNVTYFWKLGADTFEFGQCGDAPDWLAQVRLPPNEGKYLIYRTSADGRTATSMVCTAIDPSTCTPAPDGAVWTIAGRELTVTRERKDELGTSGCFHAQTLTWTLRDDDPLMQVEATKVLALVDSPTACAVWDDDVKARSPNKLGWAGCVITARLPATRVLPR